jgi:hypothetical protein
VQIVLLIASGVVWILVDHATGLMLRVVILIVLLHVDG